MAVRPRIPATLLAAVTALALSGCGGPGGAIVAPPSPSDGTPPPASASSPTPSPTPSPQAPTKRVRDCFDGDCTLLVSKPVSIPLDAETFHYDVLEIVEIGEDSLTYFVPYSGGGGITSQLGVGGGGSFGFRDETGISVQVTAIDDGVATLVLAPDESV